MCPERRLPLKNARHFGCMLGVVALLGACATGNPTAHLDQPPGPVSTSQPSPPLTRSAAPRGQRASGGFRAPTANAELETSESAAGVGGMLAGPAGGVRGRTNGAAIGAAVGAVPSPAIPEFPWPPPEPSARGILPLGFAQSPDGGQVTLQQVADRLGEGLDHAGYHEKSFYAAPGGFAVVARLERMLPDGRPGPDDVRFIPPNEREPFSLANYLQRIFVAPPGLYRVIAVVTTDQAVADFGPALGEAGAINMLRSGAISLPRSLGAAAFGQEHRVVVLVYEFRRGSQEVLALTPGRLTAHQHLERTGLAASFRAMR